MKPLTGPFNGEINPSPTFIAHAKNREQPRKQYDALLRTAEKLRTIGVQITHGDGQGAHKTLDEALRLFKKGHVRFSDLHIREAGISPHVAHDLEAANIFTVKDMANCTATGFAAKLNVLDALTAALCTLRRIVDLEVEREALGL